MLLGIWLGDFIVYHKNKKENIMLITKDNAN